jgi:large subunit ribosomal protein L10
MPRPEKVAAVQDIGRRFREADATLLTEYRGLRVAEIAEVRRALSAVGADYKVVKNTLARIAVRAVGLDELVEQLTGPTAVAFVKGDVAAAAKALDEAARRYPVLVIKGGTLGGEVLGADDARQLARLESREVLLAKVAMLANSPLQQTVNVFAALLRDLGSMLVQVVARKEQGGETADPVSQAAGGNQSDANAAGGGEEESSSEEE